MTAISADGVKVSLSHTNQMNTTSGVMAELQSEIRSLRNEVEKLDIQISALGRGEIPKGEKQFKQERKPDPGPGDRAARGSEELPRLPQGSS